MRYLEAHFVDLVYDVDLVNQTVRFLLQRMNVCVIARLLIHDCHDYTPLITIALGQKCEGGAFGYVSNFVCLHLRLSVQTRHSTIIAPID